MAEGLDRLFVRFSIDKLNQLTGRITDCLGRLSEEQIWARAGENENAVGNLVLHLCGNVRQWLIAGVGGAHDLRDRDAEFAAAGGHTAADLSARLHDTVAEAVGVLEKLTAARLAETVRIQAYDNSVLGAVYHVVEHFSQHTGQILFATKRETGEDLGYYRHLKGRAHRERTP